MLHLRKHKQAKRSEVSFCLSLFCTFASSSHSLASFSFGCYDLRNFPLPLCLRYLCTKGKAKRNGSCLQNIPTEQDLLTRRKCILHKPAVLPLAPLTSAHQLPIAACRQLGSSSLSSSPSILCHVGFFLGTLNSSFRLACLS